MTEFVTMRGGRQERVRQWGREPCFPSKPLAQCASCARYKSGRPMLPEHRACVVIDGSVIARDGACGMFTPGRSTDAKAMNSDGKAALLSADTRSLAVARSAVSYT